MPQDNQFFGLNMLPIFLQMIEAKLEIAENQLSSLVYVKNFADNKKQIILKIAQEYLLDVDRFFEQCHKWYQDTSTVEEIGLIGQADKGDSFTSES
jgi:phage gpG-like protein